MNVIRFFLLLSLIVVISWASWSCKDEISDNGGADIVFPNTNVSYGNHVEPLFYRTCAYSPCHSEETMADGLSLETYQSAISSKPGVIVPLDTANSRLIWRVEGTHGLIRMPYDRSPLTANQIKGLRTWILEGARNN
jgi:hypothetical protein